MTIGERLEEARKRKGISIREVAEATKIRGDYLMSMEDGSMDIPLPDIYKRGFLRNYARFLKLDPDKILTDYDAEFRGSSVLHRERAHNHHEERAVFGRIELPAEQEEEKAPAGQPLYDPAQGEGPQGGPERPKVPSHPTAVLTDNTLYLKIAAGLMGTVLVVFIIVLLVNLLRSDESDTAATTPPPATSSSPVGASTAPVVPTDPTTLVVRSLEENITLIVDDVRTGTRLFSGVMRQGDVQSIEKNGPLQIKVSKGAALVIEYSNGRRVEGLPAGMGQFLLQ